MYDQGYPGYETREELLVQGGFRRPPTSGDLLAERMEAGGARIEEALAKLNCRSSSLFLIAALVTVFSGFVGSMAALRHFSMIALTERLFVM